MGVETVGLFVASVAFEAGFSISAATGLTIATTAATVASIGGSIALSAALAPPAPKAGKTPKQTLALEGGPRMRIRGKALVAGVLLLHAANGNDLHRVIANCQGPCDGVEAIYINNRLVARSGNDVLTPPFGSYVKIDTRAGTADQAVLSLPNSAFSDRWPSTSRGLGLALTGARYGSPGSQSSKHPKVYPVGPPTHQTLWRAPSIYDPRVVGCEFDDAETWIWSDNGVLNVLSHLTDSRSDGGWEIPISEFDLLDIAEQAWLADAEVATRTGTEPLSRCWGVQSLGTDVPSIDTLGKMLLSTGTTLATTQSGKITIRMVGDRPEPTVTLPWDHVVSLDLTGGPETSDRPNTFKLTYYSPERRYEVAEADVSSVAWARVQDEIDRVGERVDTIELPFCPSAAQAGRIGRRIAALKRAPTGLVACNLAGLALMGHNDASIGADPLGGPILASVSSVRLDGLDREAPVTIAYTETPDLPEWVPATDEPLPPEELVDVTDGARLNRPSFNALIPIRVGNFSTPSWRWRAWLDYSGVDAGYNWVATRVRTGRTYTEWFPTRASATFKGAGSNVYVQSADPIDPASALSAIAISRNNEQDVSEWSDEYGMTVPAPNTVPATPTAGSYTHLTDGASGTFRVKFNAGLHAAYFVVVRNPGAVTVSSGDAAADGTYTVTLEYGATSQYTFDVVAYSSYDVASAMLTYDPPANPNP